MIDREHIVRDPGDVRGVLGNKPFEFVDDLDRIAAPMGLAVDLVAAPAAFVRATPRCDEVYGALPVMLAPRIDVAMNIDGMAGRPGLLV
jgi:hypothetical protein